MANGTPPWLPGCLENLAKIEGAVLCPEQHCADSNTYLHAVCYCQAPYQNGCTGTNPPANCCSYTATSPVIIFNKDGTNCYCCCGCFANDTQVAVDATTTKAVQLFLIGDPVYVAADPSLESWIQLPVEFSSGTADYGAQNTLILIGFGDSDDPKYIISNREQLFLMPDRKLKRASRLVPGRDQLLLQDGTPVPVLDLTVGKFKKGVHQIATSLTPTTNMDGHLILANGVVSGDYALQVTDIERVRPELMAEGHASLPEFGTKEYGEKYAHLLASSFKAHEPNHTPQQLDKSVFEPFGVKGPVRIPDHAECFVTKKQAEDLLEFAPHAPAYSGAGMDITNYLFKLFRGFYPGVVFYLDEENELPNAYSWIEFDVPFVVITGGLIRTNAIKYESLAFVIAHELGHLYGGPPQDERGYTCTGMADYAALLAIFPYVWFGRYAAPMMQPAYDQITQLYSYITPENRQGKPGNTCMYISIECRVQCMDAAMSTKALPECAGGPLTPTLEVTGAEATIEGDEVFVIVTFNEAVDPNTAQDIGNYAFEPLATAFSATVEDTDPAKVKLKVDITPNIEYTVTVEGVVSADGHPLVYGKNTATFELQQP
jgi:hypothetical protein